MGDKSAIEWTDATWNPVRGCTRVSEGCRNCYAEILAARFNGPGQPYEGLVERTSQGPRWTGKVALVEHALTMPLKWKKPRRIFVNSMSDLFHEAVPDAYIDRVFAMMALAPQHTFQVLTKRPERMRDWLSRDRARHVWWWLAETMPGDLYDAAMYDREARYGDDHPWPLPNVHLGVSVEDQATANERIPHLLATPAAVRFLSCEPLLGPVAVENHWLGCTWCLHYQSGVCPYCAANEQLPGSKINWVIVGGESGPNARPMHPSWARSLRDQCAAAGVPFMFKQWGEWAPNRVHAIVEGAPGELVTSTIVDSTERSQIGSKAIYAMPMGDAKAGVREFDRLLRVGKKRAGRLLDGVEHNGRMA